MNLGIVSTILNDILGFPGKFSILHISEVSADFWFSQNIKLIYPKVNLGRRGGEAGI